MKISITLFGLMLFSYGSIAQEPADQDPIAAYVMMDSVVVKPSIDIQYFIQLMRDDQTLYRSFKKLRTLPYNASYQIQFVDRKGVAKASWVAKGEQTCEEDCCNHRLPESWQFGDLTSKDSSFNYYTAAIFHELFTIEKEYCGRDSFSLQSIDIGDEEQAHIRYLKQLIFQPGVELDIPVVGTRTDIFAKDNYQSYRFYFTEREKGNSSYYIFTAALKRNRQLPIQYLETWFSKDDFQITERHFHIKTSNWIYEADVSMSIELQKYDSFYIPAQISYFGSWDIPGSKAEIGNFQIRIQPK